MPDAPPDRPLFSIVSAVYDVERYLPEFIESIEAQTFDLGRVEVIVVDDGSTDGSGALLDAWAARRPELVRVLHQENGGQATARNTGMAHARGEWVTFPDPDDTVNKVYLEKVHDFLVAHPEADMVAANRWLWSEVTGEKRNTHPLQSFFRFDRIVDLEDAEGRFHGSAPAAFFRLDRIREHDLQYDGRIRPNFEDGHFCSRYLLRSEHPMVGFLATAHYHYRKRADQSSSLGSGGANPGRYTDVFTHGYLAILDEAEAVRGRIPTWLRQFVCYEVAGYFHYALASSAAVVTDEAVLAQFHEHVREVFDRVDADEALSIREFGLRHEARLIARFGYRDTDWCDEAVWLDRLDQDQQLVRVRYRYTGHAPEEQVYVGDHLAGPQHAKTRDVVVFGRTLLHERVLWVRYRPDIRIRLDGRWMPLSFDVPEQALPTKATPVMLKRYMVEHVRGTYEPLRHQPQGRRAKAMKLLASSAPVRRKYADAWVLMDRVHDAADSGEILFKHLRAHHPDVNAWFTVTADSPHFARLKSEGYGDRLVARGSRQWRLLMANCTQLLSSHADGAVMSPAEVLSFTEPQWKFTFLQHGVIKDDISRWLRDKDINLFVTSTRDELTSIAGDHNGYPFSTKETVLTGLPRFDRLVETARRYPPAQRDLVLVAPTWREWLVGSLAPDSQERTLAGGVLDSEFVREWRAFLTDPDLAAACAAAGVRVGFLPHPNLQRLVPELDLPDHVLPLTYDGPGVDVQEYFARARVFVTDYSSIAFNAAYLERPVVYHHFDAETVAKGGHVGLPGYFDYRRDGFGPVTDRRAEAVAAVREALEHGGPLPAYQQRIEAAFPHRDGGCSERVVQAVLASMRPATADGAVETPGWAER